MNSDKLDVYRSSSNLGLKGKEMKRNWITLMSLMLIVVALVFAGCGKGGGEAAAAKPDVKQAEPVWALFVACRDNKIEDFKKAWSKRRVERLGKDWENSLKEWKVEVSDFLGKDFKLADFKFTYEGDDQKGQVMSTFKDKKLPKLRVVFEGGAWLVDES